MTLGENAANSAVDALESVEAFDGAALKLAGANRGHSLTIDSGWREVAQTALDFVKRFV